MTLEVVEKQEHKADLIRRLTEAAEESQAPTRIEGPGLLHIVGALVRDIFRSENAQTRPASEYNFPPKFKG
jgi:hypothetical protein